MTLRDVVGWLVGGFRKKGAVRLGLFLVGPPACGIHTSLERVHFLYPDVNSSAFSNQIFSIQQNCM